MKNKIEITPEVICDWLAHLANLLRSTLKDRQFAAFQFVKQDAEMIQHAVNLLEPQLPKYSHSPVNCKHEHASVKCPDCGIDFIGTLRYAPKDVPIWICSVCNGWNHVQDKFCTHTHKK